MNGIIKKIIDSKTVEYRDRVIIGFSGGPDSLRRSLEYQYMRFILITRLDLWTAMLRQNMLDAYA